MSKASNKRTPKGRRTGRSGASSDDSENSDNGLVHYFVSNERTNVDALAFFLVNYVDRQPTLKSSVHPNARLLYLCLLPIHLLTALGPE